MPNDDAVVEFIRVNWFWIVLVIIVFFWLRG